jgi:hypothetical protein
MLIDVCAEILSISQGLTVDLPGTQSVIHEANQGMTQCWTANRLNQIEISNAKFQVQPPRGWYNSAFNSSHAQTTSYR